MNYGSLFTGGGGADIGAREAGLDLAWGIEYDADIAAVANRNLGDHVRVADILDVDPHTLPAVDVLHASPPCPSFSVAKQGGEETPQDIAMAEKVASFVTVLQPQIFTLENVYAYRNSKSWRTIEDALYGAGYWLNVEHVNSADFGVPQTRKRMIVRAVKGGWVPYLPQPVEWVGWYAAIEDIIDTLPDSQFAPWQMERLPAEMMETIMVGGANRSKSFADFARKHRPTMPGTRTAERPSMALSATASSDMRAFLVDTGNTSRESTQVPGDVPSFTIAAWHGRRPSHAPIALARGIVVQMTPRALARFQSFPDWYELPDSGQLASRIIGNAVPPLGYQRIIEGLVNG